eukprot:s4263_g3.t1
MDLHFVDMELHFVRQAWHLATGTFTLCGRRGAYGPQLALVTRLVPAGAAQAWHLATWTFTLCGRRGAWRHGPSLCRGTYGIQLALVTRLVPAGAASLCVAGVELGDMHLHFVWQLWRLATWTSTWCGSRGAYGTQLALVKRLFPAGAASLCVADVALGDMDLHFVWQAWHLATWTVTLCGSSGAYGIQLALVTCLVPAGAASLCVAGVALGDMDLHFVRGAWRNGLSLCVAGVALGDRDFHFVWQPWRLWRSAGSCDALGSRRRRVTLCGRRGAWQHGPSLCVAGVALGDMDLHFVRQARSAVSCDVLGSRGRRVTLCGRRGTWRRGPSLCLPGVSLGDMDLDFARQAHSTRLEPAGASKLCVAGVALGDIDLHFVCQAWHLATWTFTLCGRGGAFCTQLAHVTRLVFAGARHLATCTFTLCGSCGTWRHGLSLCGGVVRRRLARRSGAMTGDGGRAGVSRAGLEL